MPQLRYLDAAAIDAAANWPLVIDALDDALRGGLDPAATAPRSHVPAGGGELLLMPAVSPSAVGLKVLGVAPGNPAIGLPRIQGLQLVLDAETLTPRALLDGAALTAWRTAGLSALAVRELARRDASRLVVFGTGPQARAHIAAISSIRPIRQARIVGRNPERAAQFCDSASNALASDGVELAVGEAHDIARADIVVTATSAAAPLFDADWLPERCVVVSVGAHEPDKFELPIDALARAELVLVEDRATALREAGDVIAAREAGALPDDRLAALADAGWRRESKGLAVVRSVGMAWQDLAVAEVLCAVPDAGLATWC